jgi:hypothetical protein
MVRLVEEGLIDAVATTTIGRVERFAELGIDAASTPRQPTCQGSSCAGSPTARPARGWSTPLTRWS